MPPRLSPQEFDDWFMQAVALQEAGTLDAAQAMYETLRLTAPEHPGILLNLSSIYANRNEMPQALALLDQLTRLYPEEAQAYLAQGRLLMRANQLEQALGSFDRGIALEPKNILFHTHRGTLLLMLGQVEAAVVALETAVALDPKNADAQNSLGNALMNLQRQPEALACYEKACALQPEQAIFWCNRGVALHYLGRNAEAHPCFEQALRLQPGYVAAHISRGILLGDERQFSKAFASFDRALSLDPHSAEAAWNKALLTLVQGDFAEGWKLYEARRHKPAFKKEQRDFPQPLWLGETDIAGKTILIHPEQGFGDYLQFARYALLLEARGAKVVLEAPAALTGLLKTLSPSVTVVKKFDPLPTFDLHCPLMSLPLALGSTLENIPAAAGYLHADAEKIAAWETQLGPKNSPRIGVVWSGSATHINDRNRSMKLSEYVPLFALPAEFYALQTEINPQDLPLPTEVKQVLTAAHDFSDTAALVMAIDVVITVDTSIAHLAGALGKPVWLLLPYTPDFRWLHDRTDTPWYDSMRIFRQTAPKDWAGVIARVKEALVSDEPQAAPKEQLTVEQAFELALQAHQENDLDTAAQIYEMILAADPVHLKSLSNLSSLALARENYEQALMLLERALAISPDLAPLHYNYGKILSEAKLHAEAVKRYDRAIALDTTHAMSHFNRGIALYELTHYAQAVESYSRAIALDPHSAEFYNNRGNALGHVSRFEEAIADYQQAITLAPTMADAHWNRGILQIMHGDFATGFQGYEWRWLCKHFKGYLRDFKEPLWLGDASLMGKTILIYLEQGLGDMLQFCRYIPLLEALGAKVILEVQAPLVEIISTVSPTVQVIAKGSTLPAFDYQCPIMSLPLAFKTTVETIPQHVPYLFASDEKRAEWKTKLGPKVKPRIGLVWSGSATHKNDHNRSIPLAQLAPLFDLPFEFHSLQKEVRENDQPLMGAVIDHAAELQNFSDTAALVETMDLVISVDTSVAHLAGALGKPLWIFLPNVPDYRWLLQREDTPWYPQATLFRQPQVGDWETLITRVKTKLETLF